MSACQIVTSHKKPNRYDCQDGRQAMWNDLYWATMGIAWIPVIGSIVSAGFDGYLCANAEGAMADQGCLGLGLDIGLGVALEIFPYSASVARISRSGVSASGKNAIRDAFKMADQVGARGILTSGQSRNAKAFEFNIVFQHGIVSRVATMVSRGQVKARDVIRFIKDAANLPCDRVTCRAGSAVLTTSPQDLKFFGQLLNSAYTQQKNMNRAVRERWKEFRRELALDTAVGAIIVGPMIGVTADVEGQKAQTQSGH